MLAPTRKPRRPWPAIDHDAPLPTTSEPDAPRHLVTAWQHVAYPFLIDLHTAILRRRTDVTEAQWQQIAPLLHAATRKSGRPLKNQRDVLNGVLYVLTLRCPWRQMPNCYGHYVTCWRRLLRWQNTGMWPHIMRILVATKHPIAQHPA